MGTRTTTRRTVAALAAECGVSPDAVRYYEREGLLHPPARTPAGYRVYDESAIDRLRFIKGAQRLGLRLRDIRDLLAVRDTGACPCEPAEVLIRRRIDEVDAELARLQTLRADLVDMAARIPTGDCPDPEPGTWCPDHGSAARPADMSAPAGPADSGKGGVCTCSASTTAATISAAGSTPSTAAALAAAEFASA